MQLPVKLNGKMQIVDLGLAFNKTIEDCFDDENEVSKGFKYVLDVNQLVIELQNQGLTHIIQQYDEVTRPLVDALIDLLKALGNKVEEFMSTDEWLLQIG